jgi:hypothetical protein
MLPIMELYLQILAGLILVITLHLSTGSIVHNYSDSVVNSYWISMSLFEFLVSATGNNLILLDDGCICPNHNITFQCTTVGGGITVWQGSAFQCPQSSDEIALRHAQFLGSVGVCNDGAICAHADSIPAANCFISNLTVYITPDLEGRAVRCEYDDGTEVHLIDSFTLNITRSKLY